MSLTNNQLAAVTREYEEMYLRHLQAKRDYPFMNTPPPDPPLAMTFNHAALLRNLLDREFNRQ